MTNSSCYKKKSFISGLLAATIIVLTIWNLGGSLHRSVFWFLKLDDLLQPHRGSVENITTSSTSYRTTNGSTSITSSNFLSLDNAIVSRTNITITHSHSVLPTKYFYTCGHPIEETLFLIYPELRHLERIPFHRRHIHKYNFTPHDILAYGYDGPCPGWNSRRPTKQLMNWLKQHFPGTVIIMNGEPYGFQSWDNNNKEQKHNNNGLGFHIGYGPADNVTSMKLFYYIFLLTWQSENLLQRRIFDRPSYYQKEVILADTTNMKEQQQEEERTRFLIYAASNCVKFREEAFDSLSNIDPSSTFYMGKCKGITNQTITKKDDAQNDVGWPENFHFFTRYKFCLVMESQVAEGYITEKIINAFLGGCIPIYYGTLEVYWLFNSKSFIYYDIHNPQPAIDRVQYLYHNQTAYDEVLKEPVLANGNDTIQQYFSLRDYIGGGHLKHRIRQMIDNGRARAIEFARNASDVDTSNETT